MSTVPLIGGALVPTLPAEIACLFLAAHTSADVARQKTLLAPNAVLSVATCKDLVGKEAIGAAFARLHNTYSDQITKMSFSQPTAGSVVAAFMLNRTELAALSESPVSVFFNAEYRFSIANGQIIRLDITRSLCGEPVRDNLGLSPWALLRWLKTKVVSILDRLDKTTAPLRAR